MKKIINLSLVLFLLIYLSCDTPVIFTEPQPQNYNNETSFFSYYKGTYYSELDSSLVVISDKVLYKERIYEVMLSQSVLDTMSDFDVKEGHVKFKGEKEWTPTTIVNDKVYAEVSKRDTIFEIGPDQILTMFRGHQILNNKRDDAYWEVVILGLDVQMNLAISIAAEPDDLERLEQITPVTDLSRGDTVQYLITPTVYEFNRILKEELVFKKLDYCVRVSNLIEM